MRSEILRDGSALERLLPEWEELWRTSASRPPTLAPWWIASWWKTLGRGGDLCLVACREGDALIGLAPLYGPPPRGGILRLRELRLLGEGVAPAPSIAIARARNEAGVRDAVIAALVAERRWDLLELDCADAEEAHALARRFADLQLQVESNAAQGPTLIDRAPSAAVELRFDEAWPPFLERLAREGGATAEAAFLRFLDGAMPHLARERVAQLLRSSPSTESLMLIDGQRQIEIARVGARDPSPSPRAASVRLRITSGTMAGALLKRLRSLDAVATGGTLGRIGDRRALERLRDVAPEMVQRAVAQVATFVRLHLYRGELFVRGGEPPAGVQLRLFSLADFDALVDKSNFLTRLGLVETYAREKWQRGDLVVVAELDGQPAGILWCARGRVFVPAIGREVRPLAGECYIHDVFVPPEARGRALAPAMLEFLARELRSRDVYRAWALIERSNTPSTRAFEKAAYTPAADVIYARMGRASKLLVRPPDPEARAFLGLPQRR